MNSLSVYNKVKGEMQTGDRLEWRSKTYIGWAIRKVTGDFFNHTSMIIRFRRFESQYLDNRFTLEALEGGIELNKLSRRLLKHKGEVYWYPLLTEYNEKRSMIGTIALDRVGIAYDYSSLTRQLFSKVSADVKKLFCSEYVFLNGRDAGLPTNMIKAPRPGKEMQALGWWDGGIRII